MVCPACRDESRLPGRWEGVGRTLGAEAPLTIDFDKRKGALHAFLSIRSEVLWTGYPMQKLQLIGDTILFELPASDGNGRFTGLLRGDTIHGRVEKGGRAVDVLLHRSGPGRAEPYFRNVVRFASRDRTSLSGEILIPKVRAGALPGIIFLHGSGVQSREDLRFYADIFSRNGFASLIMDKRRFGAGGKGHYSFPDLAADARAGIEILRNAPAVDPDMVGLLGISEGAWIAPLVGASDTALAFVIGIVPAGNTYAQNGIYQKSLRIEQGGATPEQVATYRSLAERLNTYVRHLKRGRRPVQGEYEALQKLLDSLRRIEVFRSSDLPRRVPTLSDMNHPRWMMLDFDPITYWRAVKAPVLLVTGEMDRYADPRAVPERILPVMQNRERVTWLSYSGVGHDLMVTPDTARFFFPHPPEGYPDTLVNWARGSLRLAHPSTAPAKR